MDGNNNIITFGELMLRLESQPGQRLQHSNSFRSYFGGAEANVSVLLSQLGMNVCFVSALPDNPIGQSAINAVRSFGTDTKFVQRSGNRIGIYYTENGNSIRSSKVVYDRKHSSFASLVPGSIDWNKILENASWFHWTGISPALTQQSAELCLEALKAAKKKGLTISADMNYRSTLWDYGKHPSEIMPELLSYCDIITGDLDTVEIYFGIKIKSGLSVEEKFRVCAESLSRNLPALKVLAMSFRGSSDSQLPTYQAAVSLNNEISFSPLYTIPQTIDRIGSGDAFMGGLIYGLLQKQSAQELINSATACAVLKHSIEGDFTIITKEDMEQFIKTGPVNRVIR